MRYTSDITTQYIFLYNYFPCFEDVRSTVEQGDPRNCESATGSGQDWHWTVQSVSDSFHSCNSVTILKYEYITSCSHLLVTK